MNRRQLLHQSLLALLYVGAESVNLASKASHDSSCQCDRCSLETVVAEARTR